MKFYEFVTVIVIFIIILVGILVGGQLNKSVDVQNTYNANLIEEKRNEGVSLDFQDEDVQKIYPFTGAFPTNDLAYLTKLKNVDRKNMTNEFVLRMGFAKVTKDDWADSYVAEDEPVEIDARILDKYIKNIFGEIEYNHTDFSNEDLAIDKSFTSLYNNKYNKETDTYTINLNVGDGVGDSYIEAHTITTTQYGDRIEIVVNPIYMKNLGQKKNKKGEYAFYYKCYSSYDFKTSEFDGELTGEIETSIYNALDNGKVEFVDEVKNINIDKLEKYTLTYRLNRKTNIFEFESLKFEK